MNAKLDISAKLKDFGVNDSDIASETENIKDIETLLSEIDDNSVQNITDCYNQIISKVENMLN